MTGPSSGDRPAEETWRCGCADYCEGYCLPGESPATPPAVRTDRDRLATILAPAVDDVFASRGYPLTDGDAQFAARYLADIVLRDWKPEEEA